LPADGCPFGAGFLGVVVVAGSRLIPVRVGGVEIEAEAVPVAGTEPTSGRLSRAAGGVADAFDRAQETIVEVARSTAVMIERVGIAARPDRVEVEFGLKFSASGGVIMAGVAGEASLKVTLSYDVTGRPAAGPPVAAEGDADEEVKEEAEVAANAQSVAAGSS
jgi:Trypsin-co-occurring domain 1